MRDEILAGIRNAMQRGESLEKAAQSFINAGYNPQEVKAAAGSISEGVDDIVHPKETQHLSPATPVAPLSNLDREKHSLPMLPRKESFEPRRKDGGMRAIIILIVFLIIIFVGALSYLIYYLLK